MVTNTFTQISDYTMHGSTLRYFTCSLDQVKDLHCEYQIENHCRPRKSSSIGEGLRQVDSHNNSIDKCFI